MEAADIFSVQKIRRLFRRDGRLVAFAVCLFVAGFLWLLTSLTRQYKVVVDFDVTYQNSAHYGINENDLPRQLSVELEDYGYNIVGYMYRNKAHRVTIDFNEYRIFRNFRRNSAYVLLNYKPEIVAKQLSNEAIIVKIEPDTIYVNSGERASKKVPVILKSDLLYKKQYMQAGTTLSPDSVTVTGPKSQIDHIDGVETELLVKEEIDGPVEERVKISRMGMGAELQVSPNTLAVKIDVQEFTEGTLEIPVDAVNVPRSVNVVLVPTQVLVKYHVPLGFYNIIVASDFKVQADCKNILTQPADYIKVTVSQSPKAVTNVQIIDDHVRFLIKK